MYGLKAVPFREAGFSAAGDGTPSKKSVRLKRLMRLKGLSLAIGAKKSVRHKRHMRHKPP
jgi:hypothetical protein